MKQIIYNPVYGQVKDIIECSDIVFGQKMVGDGIMIIPTNNTIVAPFDGEIITVSESKHAITMRSTNGVELLIHIGIDTIELNGNGFKSFAKNNEKVILGQKIMEVNFDYIQEKGYSTETMVIIPESNINIEKISLDKIMKEYVPVIICEK